MERTCWVKTNSAFSDFESDHHLSKSFQALDTKAEIHCEGSVNGKYILMACRFIAKAIISVELDETTVSRDQKQLNSPAASCAEVRQGKVELEMFMNTQSKSYFQTEVHRLMFYVAIGKYSNDGGSKIVLWIHS